MSYQELVQWLNAAKESCGNEAGSKDAVILIDTLLAYLQTSRPNKEPVETILKNVREHLVSLVTNEKFHGILTGKSILGFSIGEIIESLEKPFQKRLFADSLDDISAMEMLVGEENLKEKTLSLFFVYLKKTIASKKSINDAVKARAVFTDLTVKGPAAFKGGNALTMTDVQNKGIFDANGNLQEHVARADDTLHIQLDRINNNNKKTYLQDNYGLSNSNLSYREAVMIESIMDAVTAEVGSILLNNPNIKILQENQDWDKLNLINKGLKRLNHIMQYALTNLIDVEFSLKDHVNGFEFNDGFMAALTNVVSNEQRKLAKPVMEKILLALKSLSTNDLAEMKIKLQQLQNLFDHFKENRISLTEKEKINLILELGFPEKIQKIIPDIQFILKLGTGQALDEAFDELIKILPNFPSEEAYQNIDTKLFALTDIMEVELNEASGLLSDIKNFATLLSNKKSEKLELVDIESLENFESEDEVPVEEIPDLDQLLQDHEERLKEDKLHPTLDQILSSHQEENDSIATLEAMLTDIQTQASKKEENNFVSQVVTEISSFPVIAKSLDLLALEAQFKKVCEIYITYLETTIKTELDSYTYELYTLQGLDEKKSDMEMLAANLALLKNPDRKIPTPAIEALEKYQDIKAMQANLNSNEQIEQRLKKAKSIFDKLEGKLNQNPHDNAFLNAVRSFFKEVAKRLGLVSKEDKIIDNLSAIGRNSFFYRQKTQDAKPKLNIQQTKSQKKS